MRLIRNIFAWIAVAAVIIVMNLAIENVYCLIHS